MSTPQVSEPATTATLTSSAVTAAPATATTASTPSTGTQAALRPEELVKAYFQQISTGCGRVNCPAQNCASNKLRRAQPPMAPQLVVKKAIELAGVGGGSLCQAIPKPFSLEEISQSIGNSTDISADFLQRVHDVFSSADSLSSSFIDWSNTSATHCRLNITAVRQAFELLCQDQIESVKVLLIDALTTLLENTRAKPKPWVRVDEDLNAFIIILESPLLLDESLYESIVVPLFNVLSELPTDDRETLSRWWSTWDGEHFRSLVSRIQQFITIKILMGKVEDEAYIPNSDLAIRSALEALSILHRANQRAVPTLIPVTEFYNDAINEGVHPRREFLHFKQLRTHPAFRFTVCQYPFVLLPATKVAMLNDENSITQQEAAMPAGGILALLMRGGRVNPYLILSIRRQFVVRDTLTYISRILHEDASDLKKPLRIEFVDEEGIDGGGVSKEFFQIVIRELFDPKFGMFVYNDSTHLYWFNGHSMESPDEYKLLGIVLGLAIYNNVILDLHFPPAVYRKLMGERVGMHELGDIDPELVTGLRTLLDYSGDDLEQVYERTFTVATEVFGAQVITELCTGGAEKALTKANREEYVQLYVDYLLNKSIQTQFDAFKAGFESVCSGSQALRFFVASELELAVCGTADFDFTILKRVATYDGYESTDQVIDWFWEVVIDFTDEEKRKLLFFTTGTDRVPVGGLEKMKFVIAKQGADSDRLPTAHTCFNVILLPHYTSKTKLESLLRAAIVHSEGFGMR